MRHFDELSVRAKNCLKYSAGVSSMNELKAYWNGKNGDLDELSKHRNAGAKTVTEIRDFCTDAFGTDTLWEQRRFELVKIIIEQRIQRNVLGTPDEVTEYAVTMADAVINRMRG